MTTQRVRMWPSPDGVTDLPGVTDYLARLYRALSEESVDRLIDDIGSPDVPTAAASKGIYYVTDYGALGDGATDDTVAIKDAIAAASKGDVIYFPRGTYVVSDYLDITDRRIVGTGEWNSSIIKAKAGTSFKSLIGAKYAPVVQQNYYIEHMFFDGNAGAGAQFTESVIYAGAIFNQSSIKDTIVYNYYGAPGILVDPGDSGDGAGSIYFENIWLLPGNVATGIKITSKRGAREQKIVGLTFNCVQIEGANGYPAIVTDGSEGYITQMWMQNFWLLNTGVVPMQLNGSLYSTYQNFRIYTDQTYGINMTAGNVNYGNIFMGISSFTGTITNMIHDLQTAYDSPANVGIYVQAPLTIVP